MGGEKLRKKTVQMPSPGLLNLRGSKEKRDVSDLEKAAVFRSDLPAAPTVIWCHLTLL